MPPAPVCDRGRGVSCGGGLQSVAASAYGRVWARHRASEVSPLEAERRQPSFPVRDLTYYLDGGKTWTEVLLSPCSSRRARGPASHQR
jgi:hypothetical protein